MFVSGIQSRGNFRDNQMSEKLYNKMRKSVNEKLKKFLRRDYVDTGKHLIYPRHYDDDRVHPGVKEGGLLKPRRVVLTAFSQTTCTTV